LTNLLNETKKLLPVWLKALIKRAVRAIMPQQPAAGAQVEVASELVSQEEIQPPAVEKVAQAQSFTFPAVQLPVSFNTLRSMIAAYDNLPKHAQQDMSADAFLRISLYPQTAKLLGSEFCLARFGSHTFARQAIAAYYTGIGEPDRAHELLAEIYAGDPTPFNAIMAARCFMRPPGRERDALAYLERCADKHPDDLTLIGNLATARFVLGDTAGANSAIATVLPELRARLSTLDEEHAQLEKELEESITKKTIYRVTPYDHSAYSEGEIWAHWEPYYDEMIQESEHLYFGWYRTFYRDTLSKLSENVDNVINFGVMCGLPDFEAAKLKPGVKFWGVDRQSSTAEHNSISFPASNLTFIDAEIEDFLRKNQNLGSSALFHARTATLCYPEKIRELYKLCAQSGVKRIALFENMAMSHGTYKFMGFDDFGDKDAVIFKTNQFIHNYRKFLNEAGYRVVSEKLLFSPSITPFPEIEIGSTHIFMIAERD
jgi:hypothetical protein